MPAMHNLCDQKIAQLMNIILSAGEAVLIGGAAMRANGIERRVNDVDAYLKTDKPFISRLPHNVDVTDCDYIYGRLCIGDILNSDYQVVDQFKFKAISLETLFIIKAESAREKDINDLALIVPHITPESVMRRLGQLKPFNDESIHEEFVATAFMELQLAFGVIEMDVLQLSGLRQSKIDELNEMLHRQTKGHSR